MEAGAGYADYMLQEGVNFDQALDKIERILEQKWLSLNTINGFEAWSG